MTTEGKSQALFLDTLQNFLAPHFVRRGTQKSAYFPFFYSFNIFLLPSSLLEIVAPTTLPFLGLRQLRSFRIPVLQRYGTQYCCQDSTPCVFNGRLSHLSTLGSDIFDVSYLEALCRFAQSCPLQLHHQVLEGIIRKTVPASVDLKRSYVL